MTLVKNRISIIDARNNEHLKEEFFNQNMGLVHKVAFYNLKSVPLDKADKLSLGSFGLVKAFNTYNIDSGIAFSTYAMRCITNEILMEDRKSVNKNSRKNLHLDGAVGQDKEGNELLLMDVVFKLEDDFDSEDLKLVKRVYKKFIEVYSEKEPKLIQVFDMFVLEEKTTVEIAKKIGFGQPSASRAAQRAIKAIQKIAIEMEVIEGFNRYARRKAQ